jgi:hypothetical protein
MRGKLSKLRFRFPRKSVRFPTSSTRPRAAGPERAYPHNLIHFNKLDRGGHFAAWEQPQLFSEEMRELQITSQVVRAPLARIPAISGRSDGDRTGPMMIWRRLCAVWGYQLAA